MSTQRTSEPEATGGAGRPEYKKTLNLPKTSFPMKANLVENEPASLSRWQAMGLYDRLRELRCGRPRFAFHDGPPYANGSLHLGHLMNKCLKDFVVRSRTMAGFDVPFVPGWDCHGLPIEHKVMTDLVESGKAAKLASLEAGARTMVVRRACQAHAEKHIKLQAGQMQRMLALADYQDPYLTMSPGYESSVLEVLATLCERGLVYRALKPVHWSIANETALAEAELEYEEREDLSVYVDFEAADAGAVYDAFGLVDDDADEDEDGPEGDADAPRELGVGRPGVTPSFMIWTTTPWTLPANLAIAVNAQAEYSLVRIDGNVSVVAADLVARVTKMARAERVEVLATTRGERLAGLRYKHPFNEAPPVAEGAERCFRLVTADYVTLDDGTGLVHTAPGHGIDDYKTGLREQIPVYCPVRGDGTYDASVVEWLRGVSIWQANDAVVKHLERSGHLFHSHRFMHSYPHDWRSKTPVIFRCTEQWFIGVDEPFGMEADAGRGARSLRQRALASIEPAGADAALAGWDAGPRHESVRFVPEWGRNRMRGMLEARPDWCISRQRAWGLPIPSFTRVSGETFMTAASVRAVAEVVSQRGADAWFQLAAGELLAQYDPAGDPEAPAGLTREELASLKKGGDILDVWFESGSSWHAVMRQRFGDQGVPVELYLEGSDQHRGWFQLSLLPALGCTGRPPFRAVLTHGFMVDKDGKKLSKSAGHTIENLFSQYGADVLRWWVSSLAYDGDVKVDDEFFRLAGESYRKVRNTLRFMLSNLSDYTAPAGADDRAAWADALRSMGPATLEAWLLGELDTLSHTVRGAYERYEFRQAHQALFDFCNHTLSAVYLAAVKDRMYCDRAGSPRRRRAQAAMHLVTDTLCRLVAPVVCHTADEAHRCLHAERASPTGEGKPAAGDGSCVHLLEFARPLGLGHHEAWPRVFEWLDTARQAIERAKADPAVKLENPLDAAVTCPVPELRAFETSDLADLCGVSRVIFDDGPVRAIDLRDQPRCERSWKRDGTVRRRSDGGVLSDRDAEAVGVA